MAKQIITRNRNKEIEKKEIGVGELVNLFVYIMNLKC